MIITIPYDVSLHNSKVTPILHVNSLSHGGLKGLILLIEGELPPYNERFKKCFDTLENKHRQ